MEPEEVVRKIEEVEIQGATEIARKSVELLKHLEEEGAGSDRVEEVREELEDARPTEPLLFNALEMTRETGYEHVLNHIERSRERIASNGVSLVEDNSVIYTHCHSSTVERVLEEAFEDRDFTVTATETRPLYQGRKTAENLSEKGVPVEFYVDSAAGEALEDADMMFIGADAITPDGAINKIGSGLFASEAGRKDVPVHVFADSWKFTRSVEMEERPPSEVWENPPGNVEVRNPAFEKIPLQRIDSIVSEIGVETPKRFIGSVVEEYPEVFGNG
ncbi:MAG: translation initiation factor eIF-2B [Candidatus Nanohaloarchaea archaeon]